MDKNKSQIGSVHLVITIILAVALLGVVGFELYKNLAPSKDGNSTLTTTTKKDDSTVTKNSAATEASLTEVAFDQSNDTGFAIKYPKAWTLTHETTPASDLVGPSDTNTITSPDNKAMIELKTFSSSGRGLACSDGNNENAKVTVNDKADISGYPSAGFVNYSEATNGDYIGVYNLSAVKDDQGCRAYTDARYLLGYSNSTLVTLEAKFTSSVDMNSDNYKVAKQIIRSLYKTK